MSTIVTVLLVVVATNIARKRWPGRADVVLALILAALAASFLFQGRWGFALACLVTCWAYAFPLDKHAARFGWWLGGVWPPKKERR